MSRSLVAVVLLGTFFGVNFGLRTWRHWKATGTTGFQGVSGRFGSPEWIGGLLFIVGIALGIAAPIADISGAVPLLLHPRAQWIDALAISAVVLGIAGTTWAQFAMGASWRIGVRQDERTELIERGPFRWVRNPIFTFMVFATAGMTMFLTNVFSIAGLIALALAVELQVRFAEEPYLRRTHGESYVAYCRRVGRFIPGLGHQTS